MKTEFKKLALEVETKLDPATGKVLSEEYLFEGKRRRPGGLPAVVKYDPKTGNVIEQSYYEDGNLHRIGAPAHLEIDPVTSVVTFEKYAIHGVVHRDGDYPAKTIRDANTGDTLVETYFNNGMIHRTKGPAKIYYNLETGKVGQRTYYYRGNQCKKMDIPALGKR